MLGSEPELFLLSFPFCKSTHIGKGNWPVLVWAENMHPRAWGQTIAWFGKCWGLYGCSAALWLCAKVQAGNVPQGTSPVRSVFLGLPAAAQRSVREGGWAMDGCGSLHSTYCTCVHAPDRLYVLAFECILVSNETCMGVWECKGESTATAGLMSKSQGLLWIYHIPIRTALWLKSCQLAASICVLQPQHLPFKIKTTCDVFILF